MVSDETGPAQQTQSATDDQLTADRDEAMSANDSPSTRSETETERILVETTPTVRPTVIRLVITVVLSVGVIAVVYRNPQLLGSRQVTDIALVLIQLVLLIALVRFILEYIVLRRTKYIVTTQVVRRHFSLIGRTKTTEAPFSLVRSVHRSQSRIEYFLGFGSIVLNQGLGNIRFSAVPQHEEMYRVIHDRLTEHATTRQGAP